MASTKYHGSNLVCCDASSSVICPGLDLHINVGIAQKYSS